jgi:hypothetical protein
VIRAVIHTEDIKRRIRAMDERTRKNAFRRVMRAAAKPTVTELRAAWKAARRRRGKVTGAIAASQQARITYHPRKKMAVLQLGANYKRGGGSKLWHILEGGFRHYSRSGTYRPAEREVREIKKSQDAYFNSAMAGIDAKALARSADGRKQLSGMYRAIGNRWRSENPDANRKLSAAWSSRTSRRAAARAGGSKTIPGRNISRPIAHRSAVEIATRFRDLFMAEVMAATQGGRR